MRVKSLTMWLAVALCVAGEVAAAVRVICHAPIIHERR